MVTREMLWRKAVRCYFLLAGLVKIVLYTWNLTYGALFLSFRLGKMGGLEVSKVVDGDQGWRLITCMWLHGGVFHLLANMLSLLAIGIRLEQEFGFGMAL